VNLLDAATWAAAIGSGLGLVAAIYGFKSARRLRGSPMPESKFEKTTHVVLVSPEEERRYFLTVPAGVNTQDLLDKIAVAIQESDTGSGAGIEASQDGH
jgi:hypothetical protein